MLFAVTTNPMSQAVTSAQNTNSPIATQGGEEYVTKNGCQKSFDVGPTEVQRKSLCSPDLIVVINGQLATSEAQQMIVGNKKMNKVVSFINIIIQHESIDLFIHKY